MKILSYSGFHNALEESSCTLDVSLSNSGLNLLLRHDNHDVRAIRELINKGSEF